MPESSTLHDADAAGERRRKFDELFSLVYEELRRIASSVRRGERHATLESTALVHEAWLRLQDAPQLAGTSPLHFKWIAARVIRRVLVDSARERNALKRGGPDAIRVPLDDLPRGTEDTISELLVLEEALNGLAAMDSRQAEIAEHRIFSELTIAEIADELHLSVTTVERDWRVAKAWLKTQLFPQRSA
jgi:RNA polymerase sigma factor (TIGR02999 family)